MKKQGRDFDVLMAIICVLRFFANGWQKLNPAETANAGIGCIRGVK